MGERDSDADLLKRIQALAARALTAALKAAFFPDTPKPPEPEQRPSLQALAAENPSPPRRLPPLPPQEPRRYLPTEHPSAPDHAHFLVPDEHGALDPLLQTKADVARNVSDFLHALTERRAVIPHHVPGETAAPKENIMLGTERQGEHPVLVVTIERVENPTLERLRETEEGKQRFSEIAGKALTWLVNEEETKRRDRLGEKARTETLGDFLPGQPSAHYKHYNVRLTPEFEGLKLTLARAERTAATGEELIREFVEPLATLHLMEYDREWLKALGEKELGTRQDKSSAFASEGPVTPPRGSGWER